MRLFSTCEVCKGLLIVADRHDHSVHPACMDGYRPTRLERAIADMVDADQRGDRDAGDAAYLLAVELEARKPRLLDAALLYASWGWPVFPLRPGQKTPLTRNGFKDASSDPGQVKAWWGEQPNANVALPTGYAFDVIDIDMPDGYPAWVALGGTDHEWSPGKGFIECHGLVNTASNGYHAYITPTGGGNRARANKVPGIDFRGEGGYCVAPPSIRTDGGRWSWISKPSPVIKAAAHG